jgi:hypothetical protein
MDKSMAENKVQKKLGSKPTKNVSLLLKDCFRAEEHSRIPPIQDPYNIIWFLEENKKLNLYPVSDEQFDKKIIYCEQLIVDEFLYPRYDMEEWLKTLLSDDKLIARRMKNLCEKGADASDLLINIIRSKRNECLLVAIDSGADVNHIKAIHAKLNSVSINFPLRAAINRKNRFAQELLWSNPKVDRYQLDEMGNNIAHTALMSKDWNILEKIVNENPDLLLAYNKHNESVWNTLSNQSSEYNTYFENLMEKPKKYIQVVRILDAMMDYMIPRQMIPDEPNDKGVVPLSQSMIYDAMKRFQYRDLNKKIEEKYGSSDNEQEALIPKVKI